MFCPILVVMIRKKDLQQALSYPSVAERASDSFISLLFRAEVLGLGVTGRERWDSRCT